MLVVPPVSERQHHSNVSTANLKFLHQPSKLAATVAWNVSVDYVPILQWKIMPLNVTCIKWQTRIITKDDNTQQYRDMLACVHVSGILFYYWPCIVVKNGICYQSVCPSVSLFVTQITHALMAQCMKICFALCDREMFLFFFGAKFSLAEFRVSLPTSELKRGNPYRGRKLVKSAISENCAR